MDLSVKLQKTVTEDENSIDSVNVDATVASKNGGTTTILEHLTVSIEQLELGWTLPGLNFNQESTLHLVISPKDKMEIFVTTSTGEIFVFDFKSSDTIDIIKNRIFNRMGLCPTQQMLLFDNKLLEDNQTLEYYNVKEESSLVLHKKSAMLVFVKTQKGETFVHDVLSSDTVHDVMKSQIFTNEWSKRKRRLIVDGKWLLPYQTLEDSGVNDGTVLHLLSAPHLAMSSTDEMEIFLTTSTGQTFVMFFQSSDTIVAVKEKIFKEIGLCPSQQMLLFGSKLLEDNQNLGYYDIENESTLMVRKKGAMLIFMKRSEGETFALEVLSTDNVGDVKFKVHEMAGVRPADNHELIFDGKVLQIGRKLAYYNIQQGNTIDLAREIHARFGRYGHVFTI